MRKIKKKYLQRLKVLEVMPKDIIVLETNKFLSKTHYERLKAHLQSIFPENKILVIADAKVGVIRQKIFGTNIKPSPTSKPI